MTKKDKHQKHPYRGSTIVPVRINDMLLAHIDETIKRVNRTRRDEPFNRSTFLLAAIREKLAKYARSNPTKVKQCHTSTSSTSTSPCTTPDTTQDVPQTCMPGSSGTRKEQEQGLPKSLPSEPSNGDSAG